MTQSRTDVIPYAYDAGLILILSDWAGNRSADEEVLADNTMMFDARAVDLNLKVALAREHPFGLIDEGKALGVWRRACRAERVPAREANVDPEMRITTLNTGDVTVNAYKFCLAQTVCRAEDVAEIRLETASSKNGHGLMGLRAGEPVWLILGIEVEAPLQGSVESGGGTDG